MSWGIVDEGHRVTTAEQAVQKAGECSQHLGPMIAKISLPLFVGSPSRSGFGPCPIEIPVDPEIPEYVSYRKS